MKKFLLVVLLVLALVLCSACTSEQLGYRRYPFVKLDPSPAGQLIYLRLPLDENDYVYHSCDFENTENGIDMIIHFTKKGDA